MFWMPIGLTNLMKLVESYLINTVKSISDQEAKLRMMLKLTG